MPEMSRNCSKTCAIVFFRSVRPKRTFFAPSPSNGVRKGWQKILQHWGGEVTHLWSTILVFTDIPETLDLSKSESVLLVAYEVVAPSWSDVVGFCLPPERTNLTHIHCSSSSSISPLKTTVASKLTGKTS